MEKHERWRSGAMVLVLAILLPTSYLGAGGSREKQAAAPEDAPIIASATYQHALYTGEPQPIAAFTNAEGVPLNVTYFTSEEDSERDVNGTQEPPVAVGDYTVRIDRPAGNGYAAGPSVSVEYYIQKAFVVIEAKERQFLVYDGKPKAVAASANFPVNLHVTYYPSREDLKAGTNALAGEPVMEGTYYARLHHPETGSLREAEKTVELTILSTTACH